jgi:Ca2+-binding RTX toxin-like protein
MGSGRKWDAVAPLGTPGNDNDPGTPGDDTLNGDAGNDTLSGGLGDDLLSGGSGNDSLSGGDGNDSLYGSDGVDTLSGGNGEDLLDGGGSGDSLTGGAGNDRYVVQNTADKVVEVSGGGSDIVSSSISYTLPGNVEKLTLTGSSGLGGTGNNSSNTITGNSGLNNLSGGDGNDRMYGMDGVDTLNGGNGNDLLDGGDSGDSMTGGVGNDRYVVQNTADKVVEAGGGGIDSVSSSISYRLPGNVEKLTLTGSSDLGGNGNNSSNTITGNSGLNNLGGSDGHDSLYGMDGVDTLSGGNGHDLLDGGDGGDSMTGGAGNDRYVVDSSADRFIEASGSDFDGVYASISYTLPSEVELLALTGSSNISGTGNTASNSIGGNSGNNKLTGGGGNDSLSGGPGADIFRFSSALNASTNVDIIFDYNPADDTLELENSVFTKLTTTGVLSASSFRASSTGNAADSNDYVLYETGTGQLFYDADGNGAGAKVLVADLWFGGKLTHADIFVT